MLQFSITLDYKVTHKGPKPEKFLGNYNAYFRGTQDHISPVPCVNATPAFKYYLLAETRLTKYSISDSSCDCLQIYQ